MECDYLIIGGGSAGCIIARRLAERTSARIILIEAGKSDEGDPAANDLSLLDDQTPDYDWGFRASTLPGAAPRLEYSRAKILGGCGNHNDCAFLVPPDCDFETWESLGAKGWGPAGVRKYFARIEERVQVDRLSDVNPLSTAFIATASALGYPERDFRKAIVEGSGLFPLNARGVLRQSSSISYLHPLSSLPKNLEVWTETMVHRLHFDGLRAIGAETSRGPVTARREVILTAGSIQTPKLMMLSGLGPASHLGEHGIAVLADLPGVGSHLLDHVAAAVVWDLKEPVPAWTITPYQATLLARIDQDAPAPDVLFHFGLRVREKYGDQPRFAGATHGVKASPNVARTRSAGSVRLASADPDQNPTIALNYFSDPDGYDTRILLAAIKLTRRIGQTAPLNDLIRAEIAPGPGIVSDEDLNSYIRDICETVYHPSGTAVMGNAGNVMSVVTPDLKVKGIAGLRVCDASVFPSMVTVNINNTVMMVAEKASDLILSSQA